MYLITKEIQMNKIRTKNSNAKYVTKKGRRVNYYQRKIAARLAQIVEGYATEEWITPSEFIPRRIK
jgi:hypothetical protein